MDRVVKNEGMPISRAPGQKGDLRIKMDVQFPSRQARRECCLIFPAANPASGPGRASVA